jgi:antitoxin MazE
MKAQIVQIGNSQGIRIPKVLLEESGIQGEVDLEICEEGILIRNVSKPRAEWDRQFKAFGEADDDVPADDVSVLSEFESREWQW